MRLNIKQILFALVGLGTLVSCTETIDNFELGSSDGYVIIEGSITNELKQHEVRITRSVGYLSADTVTDVADAAVSISDDKGNTYPLTYTQRGVYKTAMIQGEIGATYTLEANLGGEIYTGVEVIKRVPPIDSIYYSSQKGGHLKIQSGRPGTKEPDTDKDHLHILIYTSEPAGKGDYYYWNVYLNNKMLTDTLGQTLYVDDQFVDGTDFLVFEYDERDEYNAIHAEVGDTVRIETRAITKGYYDHIFGVLLETSFSGSPFGGEPANIKNNLSNGAMGYFSAEAVAPYSFEVQVVDTTWLPAAPL